MCVIIILLKRYNYMYFIMKDIRTRENDITLGEH